MCQSRLRREGQRVGAIYDVAVVGLGGMGATALAECAGRGARSIGLERFDRGHAMGASSGKSRIVRQAYFEHPDYVPLLRRAYGRWHDLERATGTELLTLCGLLMAGKPESEVVHGSRLAAKRYDVAIEELDAPDLRARYPVLVVCDDEVGIFEPSGGFVRPEAAVAAALDLAEDRGAEALFGADVAGWSATPDGVEIALEDGRRIHVARLILTMGPWLGEVFASVGVPLRIERNVQAWFAPRTGAYALGRFPVFLLDRQGLAAPLYGFPDDGDGVKAAFHGGGMATSPDALDREIDRDRDIEPLAAALSGWMPGAAGTYVEGKACMYALTPDGHFVIDLHPAYPNVVICGGFSGHGFKFAPAVGEIAADLALRGGTDLPADFLSLARFA